MFSGVAADRENVRGVRQTETVPRAASPPAPRPERRAITALHRRTLEVLALALGAHAGRPPGQALRVAAWAGALGRSLGLSEIDLQALDAASLLHDIDVALGAEIVEHMRFPFPVAPLVQAHHEHWDGSGYPAGLRGDEIPLGARILAVAVCLGSHPATEGVECVRAGAGTVFDPKVAEALAESTVRAIGASPPLSFETAIDAARRKERVLSELAGELGDSLNLDETLATLEGGLKRLVAYDSLVFYAPSQHARDEDRLLPVYVSGENAQQLCALEVPLGPDIPGALAIPLRNDTEPIGVLALYPPAGDAFSAGDLRVLQRVCPRLTRAVDNARKHEHAERCSVVDPVTCLPNGRALFLRLDAELARCRRTRSTLAVLVCEIEAMERQRLQSIADGLRRICREDDCVARQGDAFVLVLSGFGPGDLPEKRKLIDGLFQEMVLLPRVGAAYYPEDGAYAEDLLAAADRRLNQEREAL